MEVLSPRTDESNEWDDEENIDGLTGDNQGEKNNLIINYLPHNVDDDMLKV